jgi:competence ComEA-like helix-hairpin-helix protein
MADTPSNGKSSPPGEFSRNELIAIYVLATALLVGITWKYLRDAHIFHPQPQVQRGQAEAVFQLDLNEATAEDFMVLPKIGKTKAEKMVEYRAKRGRFQNVDELRNVEGITPAVFEAIKGMVTVGRQPSDSSTATK